MFFVQNVALQKKKKNFVFISEIVRENVADVTNSIDKLYTTLQCRVIRIGSHKYEPTEKVIFSSKGIRIIAPNVKEKSENHILDIQSKEVVKMCSHFSKTLSIIFIYVLPSCAQFIRDSLDMSATNKTTGKFISSFFFFCFNYRLN